ncbi:sensor histidine kinase [Spirochaeta cellobiosiphila]|uniref:sensor histidine kinase n=1 Tax=Spirochaeta cellobiosiphila TaxID=504483 RepID=UPI0004169F6B|nr:sensor histidine kinase [Spirochaeta cellobiosiphila]
MLRKTYIRWLIIVLLGILIFLISKHFDLLENLIAFSHRHEDWELDELLILSLYLSITLLFVNLIQIKELRKNLRDKNTLIREINHRVKNHFTSMESFIYLQSEELKDIKCKQALIETSSRIGTIRSVYDKLSHRESDDNTKISLREYLEDLSNGLVKIFPSESKMQLETDYDDGDIEHSQATSLGIIFNEIFTNSLKYGTRNGYLKIKASAKISHKTCIVTIEDNGEGFKEDFNSTQHTGLGLTIIQAVIDQLKGTISFENKEGAHTSFSFPLT